MKTTAATIVVSGTASDAKKGDKGIGSVTVNGAEATGGSATGSAVANWSAVVPLVAGTNNIVVTARDGVGNATTKTVIVNCNSAPILTIKTPKNNIKVTTPTIVIAGAATDAKAGNSGISAVTVNDLRPTTNSTAVGSASVAWNKTVSLDLGPNTIKITATDHLGNATTKSITVTRIADTKGPVLTIRSPANKKKVAMSIIAVSGSASDARTGGNGIASVTVNGAEAAGSTAVGNGTATWQRIIPLDIGLNTITVTTTDTQGQSTTKTVTITRTK